MAENGKTDGADLLRITYGFRVVVIGLLMIAGAFVAAVLIWKHSAADVTTVMGSITGVVGTVVGAFFGVHVGSEGKEKAEQARQTAEKTALLLAAHLDPRVASRILAEAGLMPPAGQAKK